MSVLCRAFICSCFIVLRSMAVFVPFDGLTVEHREWFPVPYSVSANLLDERSRCGCVEPQESCQFEFFCWVALSHGTLSVSINSVTCEPSQQRSQRSFSFARLYRIHSVVQLGTVGTSLCHCSRLRVEQERRGCSPTYKD